MQRKTSDFVECPACEGEGEIDSSKCRLCHGVKSVRRAVAMIYDKECSNDEREAPAAASRSRRL